MTIISVILLALTGITVVALNGKDSLFSKTKQAREKYSLSEVTPELPTTETTYRVNSTSGNMMSVTVNIKNKIGIQKVIKPDNNEVTLIGSKKQIALDYDVENGKEYKFKVQIVGSNEQKEYTLKANLDAKPEIKQNNSNEYPTITEYGIEINQNIKIDSGENTDNYYSLDNGDNWFKYPEYGINVKKEEKILAKSVINGEITKESQEKITIQLSSDVLGMAAYDRNLNTYVQAHKTFRASYGSIDWWIYDSK